MDQPEAFALAHQCASVLRDRFGAQRVIVFGSVTKQDRWCSNTSDIDLAVEGLSLRALAQAEVYLRTMVPTSLRVDLVELETVAPAIRVYIEGDKHMPDNPYLALHTRIEVEMGEIDHVVTNLQEGMTRAGATPDEFSTRALASYIDDFYSGCERIGMQIARTLDGSVPQGESWHRALLDQMADYGGHGRPPVLSTELLHHCDEYRTFRHIVRVHYGHHLLGDRTTELARHVADVYALMQHDIGVFVAWLEQQAGSGCYTKFG